MREQRGGGRGVAQQGAGQRMVGAQQALAEAGEGRRSSEIFSM